MKCKLCEKEGKTSKLNISPKATRIVKGEKETYWDDKDVYHSHSPDQAQVSLWCSNGHKGKQIGHIPCPAKGCDYGHVGDITEWEVE